MRVLTVPSAVGGAPDELGARRARRARRGPSRAAAWLATAAAVAGLVGVGVWGLDQRAERDRLLAAAGAREAVLTRLAEPGAAVVALQPVADGDGASAAVVVTADRAFVVVEGLAPNDAASSTYVLWEQPDGGDLRAAGTFDVTEPGVQVAELPALAEPDALGLLAVSREPGRTAPAAPSQPLLAGTVA